MFSNSYIRALSLAILLFLLFVGVTVQRYGLDYWGGHRGGLILSMLVVSLTVTTALVGTFSRGEKPWPWLKTAIAYFGCWLATIFVMSFMVFVLVKPH